jgi:predicted RNA methylase
VDTVILNATSLSGSVDTIISNVTSLSGSVDTVILNATSLSGSVDTVILNATSLSGSVDTIISNATSLSGSVDTMISNVTSLSGSVDSIITNVTSLSGSVDSIITDINNVDASLNLKQNILTAGTNITISGDTISAGTISAGSSSSIYPTTDLSSYAYYYTLSNQSHIGNFYLVYFESSTLQSALITRTTNSRFTCNKTGYYLVNSSIHLEILSYNDRVCFRALFLKNGVEDDDWSGDSFAYGRDNNFGDFETCPLNRVINLTEDDYIEVKITAKKAAAGFFGTDMEGTRTRLRSSLSFQYLGS